MNSMTYRGYTAHVAFDERDDIFTGQVLGARDAISFHADTVADLRREFRLAVDDYLAYCAEKGVRPDKPASGRILLRVSPEVHAAAILKARAEGKSLNQFAAGVIEAAAL
ncbi:MAG: type II toxin-antitoxin system HicB family antitoxin [Zoogloeaceae bacterium]|jgi:predicted HicB family RNase H-like nuclease|nr:type II toxin-antitoxin system HicB family antitoxin [Zoogloeaceae bacterium]